MDDVALPLQFCVRVSAEAEVYGEEASVDVDRANVGDGADRQDSTAVLEILCTPFMLCF